MNNSPDNQGFSRNNQNVAEGNVGNNGNVGTPPQSAV